MFILHTVKDTLRITADSLSANTVSAIKHEIDSKYSNRILMDVGLVIGRYDQLCIAFDSADSKSDRNCRSRNQGSATNKQSNKRRRLISSGDGGLIRVGHGVCVSGDSGSHHECIFKLIVFRPFVNEVCIGTIQSCSMDGIVVSVGFFTDIFIPAYWMLNPSYFDFESNLWIWTPQYDEDDENEDEDAKEHTHNVKSDNDPAVTSAPESSPNRYEMDIGSEIRFKVKSINFTQITNTAKGMQATTISMGSRPVAATKDNRSVGNSSTTGLLSGPGKKDDIVPSQSLQRLRSSSFSNIDEMNRNVPGVSSLPSSMQIIGSICEDGLGLTSWWVSSADDGCENDEEELFDKDIDDQGNDDVDGDEIVDEEYFEEYE